MLLHYAEMYGIARGKALVTEYDRFGALDGDTLDGKYLINDAKQGVKRRLNCIATVDGNVPMENFLQNFGVGDQSLSLADQSLDQSLCVNFVRMSCAHQIHWNVGVDQNHDSCLPKYPCSISARMVSMSPVGNSCFTPARMT